MNGHLWERRARRLKHWRIWRCRECRTYMFTKNPQSAFLALEDCPAGESD